MTNQTIDIASLVMPKYKPGQLVYRTHSDSYGINSVRRVRIEEIRFVVSFRLQRDGTTYRETSLVYDLLGDGQAVEDHLFASLEEVSRSAK